MTWRGHFHALRLESPITGDEIDTSHDAYQAFQRLAYHATDAAKSEVQLQTCLVDLARVLFEGPRDIPPDSEEAWGEWLRGTRARGELVSEFGGAGTVEAEIGGDLLQLHTLDGVKYKKSSAYLAETEVLDHYKQLVREAASDDHASSLGKRIAGTAQTSNGVQAIQRKKSRPTGRRKSGSRAVGEGELESGSVKTSSSRQTGAGTRLPDVWILASCYMLAEMSTLDRRLKQRVTIYKVASALFEVKKHIVSKAPTKDAINKVCEGLAQMILYLCACHDISGTFVGACMVNTRFSRACLIGVTLVKSEVDEEDCEPSSQQTQEAYQRVYEIALEVHENLGAALQNKSIPLSALLGDDIIQGLTPKDRYYLLANDIIDEYDQEGRPRRENHGLRIGLSPGACARLWDLLRIAVELICDLPWNTSLSCFSPASSLFLAFADALRQARVESVPSTRDHHLCWAEMSKLCAVRRGHDYVSRLFPAASFESDHSLEFEVKTEPGVSTASSRSSRKRPSTSECERSVSRAPPRRAAKQLGVTQGREGHTGDDQPSGTAAISPVQGNLRPSDARVSPGGESSSGASRRLVTPNTARDAKLSTATADLAAAKQATFAFEHALDSSPQQQHRDSPEQLHTRAPGLGPAPTLTVHSPEKPKHHRSANDDNILRWRESCSTSNEDSHQYAGPAVWPRTPEPQIRILLVSPTEMDRLLELRRPATT